MSKTAIGKTLDHTLLKPEAVQSQFDHLCEEAKKYDLGYVCVPGSRLESAVRALSGTEVKVACVMGFPHGNGHARARAQEAVILLGCGAAELDMVLDVGDVRTIARKVEMGLRKSRSAARTKLPSFARGPLVNRPLYECPL